MRKLSATLLAALTSLGFVVGSGLGHVASGQEVLPPPSPPPFGIDPNTGLPLENQPAPGPGYAPGPGGYDPLQPAYPEMQPPYDEGVGYADPGAEVAWENEQAQAEYVDDGYDGEAYVDFQASLSPYGQWVDSTEYGNVWVPSSAVVGADFMPYGSGGHWVLTEYGWTWVSDWDWGWAPFHYGRWATIGAYGWCWVPGRVWGPAWVSWRWGGGHVGWAPLGPRRGITIQPPPPAGGGKTAWRFTTVAGLGAAHPTYLSPAATRAAFDGSSAMHNVQVMNRFRVEAGPSPHLVANASGRTLVPTSVHSLAAAAPRATIVPRFAAGMSTPRGLQRGPVTLGPRPGVAAPAWAGARPAPRGAAPAYRGPSDGFYHAMPPPSARAPIGLQHGPSASWQTAPAYRPSMGAAGGSPPAWRTSAPAYRPPPYSTPAWRGPSYSPPAYRAPSAPSYAAPAYRGPSYAAPAYRGPTYSPPAYRAPTYSPPAYRPPSMPSYAAPRPSFSSPAPAYHAPSYSAPTFHAPTPSFHASPPASHPSPSFSAPRPAFHFGGRR